MQGRGGKPWRRCCIGKEEVSRSGKEVTEVGRETREGLAGRGRREVGRGDRRCGEGKAGSRMWAGGSWVRGQVMLPSHLYFLLMTMCLPCIVPLCKHIFEILL